MQAPHYLDLEQARQTLSEFGIDLNERQMKRAAEKDAAGKRKLPFFIDPIDKRLKIEKSTLMKIYFNKQVSAEKSARSTEFD